MTDPTSGQQKRARALIGVVAASALVYPLLVCAVELLLAQLGAVDVAAIVLWLGIGLACSVGLVAAVRCPASARSRRVRSPWLLLGLVPPVLYEVWLLWPLVAA